MVELYPHQRDALTRLRNGSILWGGVGTGKSLTAVAYYMEQEAPKPIYVITTAKKRDSVEWEGEFAKFGVGKAANATVAGILTVDSWNNIGKYRDVEGAFFIFDEQRLVGSGDWVDKFLKIASKNRWILLTATPGDNWLDYIPVFIANGFYKNRTEFKRDHVVYQTYSKFPKVERYTGVGRLVRLRNQILVEMPYLKKTVRHDQVVRVEYDKELYDRSVKRKWNPFLNQPMKDVAELFRVMRYITNINQSRLEAIRTILKLHPRLIIYYNFDYELELLRTLGDVQCQIQSHQSQMKSKTCLPNSGNTLSDSKLMDEFTIPATSKSSSSTIKNAADGKSLNKPSNPSDLSLTNLVVAEYNGHKHERTPRGDNWVYLVQYAAGSEGWNCTTTDAMVFYSLPYSYKMWHQAHGRIDRLNTPYQELYYYILMSDSRIDKSISRALENKKNFNESAQTWAK